MDRRIRYSKKNGLKVRDLGSKMLIYDYKKGILIELNESAKLVWSMLEKSIDEIARFYANHYKIDLETAFNDVKRVIQKLEKIGVIRREKM